MADDERKTLRGMYEPVGPLKVRPLRVHCTERVRPIWTMPDGSEVIGDDVTAPTPEVIAARQAEVVSPLVTYMTAETAPERDAAFLRMYAARVLDRTASSWEIPNTVATTLQDIANRIEAAQPKK
jgi:hypothetical protein